MSTKTKRNRQRAIQEQRLLVFNQTSNHYEEKKVNNEWWVKNYNGDTGNWQVSIYSNESYAKYKQFTENRANFKNAISKD